MSQQVILMDDVEHLGKIGDTVHVRDGYARNYLLPKGLAEPVTKNALRKLDKIRKEREELLKIRRAEAMDKAGKLRGQTLTIAVKAVEGDEEGKLYGSVTAADIAKALTEAGVAVDPAMVPLFEQEIDRARMEQDSVGGIIECQVTGVPCGLGEPVFDTLDAALAAAIMSIGACKGVEIGSGFEAASMRGSRYNDQMHIESGRPVFESNRSGGIQGGISNGQPIVLRAAFKPTPSIGLEQHTVTRTMEDRTIRIGGRHDPCIVPRAVVVVEAMTALVIADSLLRARAYGI